MTNIQTLLNTIDKENKFFTVCFTKANGEQRIMNCQPRVQKYVKGTGTEKQGREYQRVVNNNFKCYEVQITNAQRQLDPDKVIGYKTFKIDSVKWIKYSGSTYEY